MLQQPQITNTQTQSSLLPTSSPQSESSDSVQGTASQELLRSEGQTITVPSSRGISGQEIKTTLHQGDASADVSFQPAEIAAIFIVVGVLLVATATYVVKKAKPVHMSEVSGENDLNQAPVEQEQATESVVTRPPAKKKRQKKQTRRQRRQSAK